MAAWIGDGLPVRRRRDENERKTDRNCKWKRRRVGPLAWLEKHRLLRDVVAYRLPPTMPGGTVASRRGKLVFPCANIFLIHSFFSCRRRLWVVTRSYTPALHSAHWLTVVGLVTLLHKHRRLLPWSGSYVDLFPSGRSDGCVSTVPRGVPKFRGREKECLFRIFLNILNSIYIIYIQYLYFLLRSISSLTHESRKRSLIQMK